MIFAEKNNKQNRILERENSMNKLELEMHKSKLEYAKEICENKVKLRKSTLLLSRMAAVISAAAVSWFVYGCMNYSNRGGWFFIAFCILCIVLNVGVFIVNVDRIRKTEQILEYEEEELEGIKKALMRCKVDDCLSR